MKMWEPEEPRSHSVLLPESRGAPKFKSWCEGLPLGGSRGLSPLSISACAARPKLAGHVAASLSRNLKPREASEALAEDRGCTLALGKETTRSPVVSWRLSLKPFPRLRAAAVVLQG